jgi:hypothetical protein
LMWNEARSRASFGPITLVNLSTVVLKSLACICCNPIVIVMSNNPLSHSCCALCASKLPPSIRARLTSERLLHAAHSSPRLLLMTSQSRQKTAFERGRTPASRWFLVPANIYTNLCPEMWAAIVDTNTANRPYQTGAVRLPKQKQWTGLFVIELRENRQSRLITT